MTAIPVRDLLQNSKVIPLPVRRKPGEGKAIPATPLTAEQKKAADLCAVIFEEIER
jgi:hypothetical protein